MLKNKYYFFLFFMVDLLVGDLDFLVGDLGFLIGDLLVGDLGLLTICLLFGNTNPFTIFHKELLLLLFGYFITDGI